MNRQRIINLLESNLSDEDVLELLREIVCIGNKGINTDMYRPTYQPWVKPPFVVSDTVGIMNVSKPNYYTDH
jgi:hypothetical protein